MLLMLKVATFNKSLSVPVFLGAPKRGTIKDVIIPECGSVG